MERKGCKLLRSLRLDHRKITAQIRYKQFFDNTKPDIRGKRVAIIDDASKYTSTLLEYRDYFEKLGATVDTYSFVGQSLLCTGEREKFDVKANIFQFLNESTYQEYIIQQSIELSKEDNFFDVDHLVFRTKISADRFKLLFDCIEELGKFDYANDVYTPESLIKFCVYDFTFPIRVPFDSSACIYDSPIQKIRLAYNKQSEMLSIVPMEYVSWDSNASVDLPYVCSITGISPLYESGSKLGTGGMYMNIVYICSLFLLKAFLSQLTDFPELNDLEIEDYDLLSYAGIERIDLLKNSIALFLKCDINYDTYSIQNSKKEFDGFPKFQSVLSFMKQLRSEYERRIEIKNSVLGVQYYLPYAELFARYAGRSSIMKWIDILCDRGVLVTRNVNFDGFYCRACRSGEADYDHIETKTSILLPIIINICGKRDKNVYRINATLLNKIIANLVYDYPSESFDFHNFFTKPYLYGPFTYVKNQLNDEVEISLYDAEKISKYCIYDEQKKEFIALAQEHFSKDIDAFSQCDMVPFTEITSYLDCLCKISSSFNKADILNELVICRNQNIYYRHVHFDLDMAYNNIVTAYRTSILSKSERYLRDAAKVANEALKKLNYNPERLFDKLKRSIGTQMLYRAAYQKILASKIDFDDSFRKSMDTLRDIAYIEQALINLMLYTCTFNRKYLLKFLKVAQLINSIDQEGKKKLEELCNAETIEKYKELSEKCEPLIRTIIEGLYTQLHHMMKKLPKPSDDRYALSIKQQNLNVAVNRCIQHIKKNGFRQYTLLHFDYAGFRNTEGSKSVNVIDCVQNIVPSLLDNSKRDLIVYGLTGELSCGTILFSCIEDAISFAQKMRDAFAKPELAQVTLKFGCCCWDINDERRLSHDTIKKAWDTAIACSTSKHTLAGFMIAQNTYNHISEDTQKEFMMAIPVDHEGEISYFAHKDFISVDSSQVINYQTNTDNSIEIGIVTALTEEFVAMQKMLIDPKTVVFPKSKAIGKTTGREYCVGKIRSLDGKYHQIALTQTLSPGNTSAAMRASSLLEHFPKLDVIIMTGIAGGIPDPENTEKHVRLGDIVVAQNVVAYDFVSERRKIIELRGPNIPPSARLTEAQERLRVDMFLGRRPWESYIDELCSSMPTTFARPAEETDILYDHKNQQIPHPADPSRTKYPRVFETKIACANRVLKNPKKRDQLKRDYDVHAVEMESSGIADATWQAQIGYYVIRGISDYCDGHKNDIWHNYAALVAAAYTRALVEKLLY